MTAPLDLALCDLRFVTCIYCRLSCHYCHHHMHVSFMNKYIQTWARAHTHTVHVFYRPFTLFSAIIGPLVPLAPGKLLRSRTNTRVCEHTRSKKSKQQSKHIKTLLLFASVRFWLLPRWNTRSLSRLLCLRCLGYVWLRQERVVFVVLQQQSMWHIA